MEYEQQIEQLKEEISKKGGASNFRVNGDEEERVFPKVPAKHTLAGKPKTIKITQKFSKFLDFNDLSIYFKEIL